MLKRMQLRVATVLHGSVLAFLPLSSQVTSGMGRATAAVQFTCSQSPTAYTGLRNVMRGFSAWFSATQMKVFVVNIYWSRANLTIHYSKFLELFGKYPKTQSENVRVDEFRHALICQCFEKATGVVISIAIQPLF